MGAYHATSVKVFLASRKALVVFASFLVAVSDYLSGAGGGDDCSASNCRRLVDAAAMAPKLRCALCVQRVVLPSARDFVSHVRIAHCLRVSPAATAASTSVAIGISNGGVGFGGLECRYSAGSALCAVLRDAADFEAHVLNVHLASCSVASAVEDNASGESSLPVGDVSTAAAGVSGSAPRWSVYDCTQNLPALLNDPNRRRESDFFSRVWGDTFVEPSQIEPCPFLPIVKKAAFEEYLERIRTRLQRRAKSAHKKKDERDNADKHASTAKSLELTIDQVPSIFFRPNFDLSDPETFSAVLSCVPEASGMDAVLSPSDKKSKGLLDDFKIGQRSSKASFSGSRTSDDKSSEFNPSLRKIDSELRKKVQDRLGQLTDLIEVRLIQHISQHSDAFFDAMTSQDELAERMATTLSSIATMRERIAEIEKRLVLEPLRVLQLHQQRRNILLVIEKLELMLSVHQAQPTIQVLLANCEFVGALDLIDTTQEILNQELKDVVCFRHLGHQLTEIESLILRILETDFKRYTAADLNRDLNSGPQIKDHDQLRAIISGLFRLNKGLDMVRWYREEATAAVQAMLKQTQVEFAAEMTNEDIVRPEQQLEHLAISEWMTLLYRAFNNMEKLLLRVRAVYDLCIDILNQGLSQNFTGSAINLGTQEDDQSLRGYHDESSIDNQAPRALDDKFNLLHIKSEQSNGYAASVSSVPDNEHHRDDEPYKLSSPLARMDHLSVSKSSIASSRSEELVSESERGRLESQLGEMLLEVSDAAHDACARLVSAKNDDGSLDAICSADFVALCQGVESFSTKCEKVCRGRRGKGLRLALQSRANRFVCSYHDQHKDTLLLVLENEPFKAVKVPLNIQNMLTSALCDQSGLLHMVKTESVDASAVTETLTINGDQFVVCGCTLHLIKLLLEYCQTSIDIPMLVPDILTRLLDLLRHFNTAVYKLVLGPASTRGFSGPTISKLLIASRALELIERLVPYIQGHFERCLARKQLFMVRHFTQLSADLREHSSQIEARVLTLATDAVDTKLGEWVLKAPVPSVAFRGITAILIAVNNSLSSSLPEDRGVEILKKCHQSFLPALRKHLLRLGVKPDGGPQHGMVIQELTFYAEILKRNGVPSIEFDGVWAGLYGS